SALGFYWPALTAGVTRTVFLTVLIALIAAINIRGIRQSSFVVNLLTVGKLLPLVVFIAAGWWVIDWSRLGPGARPAPAHPSASGRVVVVAFGGYEVVPVPGGESRDPQRTVPFALIMTIVIAAMVMTLAQVVALGTYPGLATSKAPLAEATALVLGAG